MQNGIFITLLKRVLLRYRLLIIPEEASLSSYFCFFIGCLLFIHFVSSNEFSIFHAAKHRVAMVLYIYSGRWYCIIQETFGENIISNDKCAIFFFDVPTCNAAVPLQSCIDDRSDYTVPLFPFLDKIRSFKLKLGRD